MMALQNGLHQRGWLGQMVQGRLGHVVVFFLYIGPIGLQFSPRRPTYASLLAHMHTHAHALHSFYEHL